MTTYLSAHDLVRLVSRLGLPTCMAGIARCIEADFRRWGDFDKSARIACHSADGVIELMPIADASQFAFKYVNGHPKNTLVGLPTVMAFGVLADVATGAPRLLSELTLTTAMRTAAMSALAARTLARPGSRVMALVGNGAQAEFQAVALRDLVGIRALRLYDVDPAATAKLVANLGGQGFDDIRVCASTAEAVRGAHVVTTVTADKQRATIITPEMVESGMHFNAVGGDCPGKTELHRGVLEAATRVFVEYEPQTRIEGDIQQMPADFGVTELWQVLNGALPGRTADQDVTVFDSVGFALEDYSALCFVRDAAEELGIGDVLQLIPELADPKNLYGLLRGCLSTPLAGGGCDTCAMTTDHGLLTPALLAGPLRAAITAATRAPEPALLPGLLDAARLAPTQGAAAQALALRVARGVRDRARDAGRAGLVQRLLQEFALSSQEGVALMCLAEALLRIPDAATRDALIRDKISHGNWQQHLGQSPSLFVNAATWGLLLTGKLVATHSDAGLTTALRRIVGRGGEPLIRKGVDLAMRLMGEQFVTGETIEQALANARAREAEGFRYSYDMLGEAAMTADDAGHYLDAYEQAIHAIGKASAGRGIYEGPGISIKLSALHPRYVRAQVERVKMELYPRLLKLALLAKRYDIGLNIDAEEADRLELSLDLLERLCFEPALAGWNGIGFVIQTYQKRCPMVIDWIVDLARRSKHRLMIRLVKGAYWDSEIKRAQLDGQRGYPVYTRKAYTDVAYIACAKKLLAATDAVYPQFATHNAHTLAAVHALAGQNYYAGQYEFQCLHGMGEPLYEQVVGKVADGKLARPCRIYAPVGSHDTLLAYLVRRLLENGANTSFVNRIADDTLALEQLVEDPVRTVESMAASDGALGLPHPAIPLPAALFGARVNSRGIDLADESQLALLAEQPANKEWVAEPLLAAASQPGEAQAVLNPSDARDVIGHVCEASAADVQAALAAAVDAAPAWAATPPAERAAMLERAADAIEADTDALIALLQREAGKTTANAVAEIREAVDFLRYDADQVRKTFDNATHHPLGPVVCISPWNFPLAIFTGQVAAALAAGNTVLAKPAEQTPLVAAAAVRALHAAGVPRGALQLLPGQGETVGAALVGDPRVMGVVFTGSTEVARLLQKALAPRTDARGAPVPLIAETGGQNAMVVDSSALAEQVVADVVASAFDSAGQRCSALRVLCLQDDIADRVTEMLQGAMRELVVGNPRQLATDVGPVIDRKAQANIRRHIATMQAKGRVVTQPVATDEKRGTFVAPTLIEIQSLDELEREVFGPVLHLLRYHRDDLDGLIAQINATGYGLTFGVHTRIDETVARVATQVNAGNVYVNRNMVGAVVGVQPFGGEGLSGTGPKAGGPLYLLRLLRDEPPDAARRSVEAAGPAAAPPVRGLDSNIADDTVLTALQGWARAQGDNMLAEHTHRLAARNPCIGWRQLAGPTGEANLYAVLPRDAVLCIADSDAVLLRQLAAVLAVGSRAVWPAATGQALHARLPDAVRDRISLAQDWRASGVHFDAALHSGSASSLQALRATLAQRAGPIVGVTAASDGCDIPLERLVNERSLSINTAAAGGNASLMTIG